jgi:hypothetical protein
MTFAVVRLLLGAAPLILLTIAVLLLCLISLALNKAGQEHVLKLLDRLVELTETIVPSATTGQARRRVTSK